MPTVILGGGIIGSSIAYYLSAAKPAEEIHIVESASELFNSASGYAAGFLARDWFAPSLQPLGKLSFDLHESLAAEQGGAKKWGYMKGTALSLGSTDASKGTARGDDWLRTGTSRAETATSEPIITDGPEWLTKQHKTAVEQISDETTVAQVDPLRLSQFLLKQSLGRGVRLHQPCKATSLVTDKTTGTIRAVRVLNVDTKTESTLFCTNLIICAGSWTPRVWEGLFPTSDLALSIYPLAGYSIVLRSPRYTTDHEETISGRSHAIFTTHPPSCGFSPEMFSREGGEIYIAGLNSTTIPVPDRADDTKQLMDKKEMEKLKTVTVRLMGKLADGTTESTDEVANVDDLDIVREGLCFRPVAERGVPYVSRVDDKLLGGGLKADRNGGVFVASGHGPWGISLSLGTGKVMADLVTGAKPAADVSGLGVRSLRETKL